MTGTGTLETAIALVELGIRAVTAYGRPDLAARLSTVRRGLADPAVHIVVAGEFKQGKSSLVNALLGAAVCPIDDDVATAVPTYVRYGAEVGAELLYDGDPPRREPVPMAEVRAHVVEDGGPAPRVAGVEIRIPRQLLAGGVVMVDTPGVGGLGSAHAAASLAAISMADAVLLVTDAAQELTRSEVDFLRQAHELCGTVLCVLSKIDFYPRWRTIRDLNEGHLRRAFPGTGSGTGDGAPVVQLVTVSSPLRNRAVSANDAALNTESGFPALAAFVSDRVGGGAAQRLSVEAGSDVAAVCEQIATQFEAERKALADPESAQRIIDELTTARERVEALKTAAARWSQTLNDGIGDLTSDVDHDLRHRIRQVVEEADEAIEAIDPADTWPQMESWLQARAAHEALANYTLLRQRAEELGGLVAEHFRQASGEAVGPLAVYNPTPVVSKARVEHKIELDKMKAGKQAMVALKSAYGGALMFTMLGSLIGVMLGPVGVGIGLVMGHKGLRDEKKRQAAQRRSQAKNAMRRYCDEVSFVVGKDSRDTLRRIQRQLRDHYTGLAEELNKSNAEAINAATEAARRTQSEREKRLRDLDAEVNRLHQLRDRAVALAGAGTGPGPGTAVSG